MNVCASAGRFEVRPTQKKSFWTTPFSCGLQYYSTSALTPFGR